MHTSYSTGQRTPYQLLTSTRYDPFLSSIGWNNDTEGPCPFFLLPFHFDRLTAAANTHNWLYAKSQIKYRVLKALCVDAVSEHRTRTNAADAFKIRITVSKDGRVVVVASPLAPAFASDPTSMSLHGPLPIMSEGHNDTVVEIYTDREPSIPSVFTMTKTTFRDVYEDAKARNGVALPSKSTFNGTDILLYNPEGQIMETTIFNIAFYRAERWVTPSLSSGCLAGVVRRWLLDNHRIFEDDDAILTKDSIHQGEWVLLCNGVQGCRLGRVFVNPPFCKPTTDE